MKRVKINLNGDNKESLLMELRAAMYAVNSAIEKVNGMTVHGRNYVADSVTEQAKLWDADLREKRAAIVKLSEVKDWLEDCALNVTGQ